MFNLKKVLLAFFGIESKIKNDLKLAIKNALNFKVEIIDANKPVNIPKRGNQLLATSLLPTLETFNKKGDFNFILGVINEDLYVPELNFVFGIANDIDMVAIISINRLHSTNYNLFLKRTVTESIHELGHLFGFDHCQNPKCVMFFSNSLNDTDFKSEKFCSKCHKLFKSKFGHALKM